MIQYFFFFQDKIFQYTRSLLDKASVLIADRLDTEVLQIPKSMEAPGMRLVLLPDIEGYEKVWVSDTIYIVKYQSAILYIKLIFPICLIPVIGGRGANDDRRYEEI
jgi:hypothetical protein